MASGFLQRRRVKSSAVRSVGYDPRSEILEVEFPSGVVYDYHGVPAAEVLALLTAESIGGYMNAQIKPRYPCTQYSQA
jgi:hypothetical protein